MAKMPLAMHDFAKTNGLTVADHGTHNDEPSMTRQEFMAECDINTIMAQYDGYLSNPMASMLPPRYVDFTQLPDTLMGTMAMVHEASEAFFRLPAKVRKEFDNDPVAFADFAADPTNLKQMREWGLAPPEKAPEAPMRVEVVNPTPKEPAAPTAPEGASTHGST